MDWVHPVGSGSRANKFYIWREALSRYPKKNWGSDFYQNLSRNYYSKKMRK